MTKSAAQQKLVELAQCSQCGKIGTLSFKQDGTIRRTCIACNNVEDVNND